MTVYLVEYAIAGKPASKKVIAEECKWLSASEVEFIQESKVVARFSNVSSVVDSENIRKAESSPPQKIVFG